MTNAEFARFLKARGAGSPEGEDYFDLDDADVRIHFIGFRCATSEDLGGMAK